MLTTDFLSAERRARLLATWERCVREEPDVAWQAGPPNWLVREKQRKGEDFHVAAVRVKAEYLSQKTSRTVTEVSHRAEVSQPTVTRVTLCPVCGVRELSGKQKVCSGACRMRQKRRRG